MPGLWVRRCRGAVAVGAAALLAATGGGTAFAGPTELKAGVNTDVAFDAYPRVAETSSLLSRNLTPLAQEAARLALAQAHEGVDEHALDLSRERFVVYVPRAEPAAGYGLLVFVPPWDKAQPPYDWARTLNHLGVIFISADRSGNDTNTLSRREPLALVAAAEMLRRFHIDPTRVYVGGFSGGSGVALRLALAYPDLFDGALLDAGSDPIGAVPDSLPAPDLLSRFQVGTRLVLVSGDHDTAQYDDEASAESLRRYCNDRFTQMLAPSTAHQLIDRDTFEAALETLDRAAAPAAPDRRLAACRADLDGRMAKSVADIGGLLDAGRTTAAQRAIMRFDSTYGSYAGSRAVDLARRCRCRLLDPKSAENP